MPRRSNPDAFTRAYIEAALWSTSDESDEQGGEPLDKNYGPGDIAAETMELIEEDCADFQKRFGQLIEDDDPRGLHGEYDRWEKAGHDFWLTRNGHGAGFWDGDWPKHGDELTEAAKSYGEFELYVGDDGMIYGPTPDQYRNPPDWLKKRYPSRGRTEETRQHTVRDFNSIEDLIKHAKDQDGATHVIAFGSGATLYFPFQTAGSRVTQYEEARAWRERGYWHLPAEGARKTISQLPDGAQPIDAYLSRSGGRRAAEPRSVRESHVVRDYIAVDSRGRPIAGPSSDYGAMRKEADRAGGYVKFASGDQHHAARESTHDTSRRRKYGKGKRLSFTQAAVSELADELAVDTAGDPSKPIQGGFRWSDPNFSAVFETRSPEHMQPVFVVVSVFRDGSLAMNFFSDKSLSETDRYESISGFTYASADFDEMISDINWVRKTVDGYAESWQQPEVDERRRSPRRTRRPHRAAGRRRR